MTLIEFLRLMAQHIRLMLLVAVLMGGVVLVLTKDSKENYASKTVINTGLVSSYNIENHDSDGGVDRDYANNELMNLLTLATAYETMEELSARLIARYLMITKPDSKWVISKNFEELREVLPTSLSKELVDSSFEQTYQRVLRHAKMQQGNDVEALMYSDKDYFGIDYLKKQLKVDRKPGSDLLEFSYATFDPAVCQQTLLLWTSIFIEKQRKLKESQSTSVLDFFKRATEETAAQLRDAEAKLLAFQVENKIINYYEQTRFIADRKESLDEEYFKESMELQAMQSALVSIEVQLNGKIKLSKLNDALLEKRQELTLIAEMLAKQELLASDPDATDVNKINALRTRFDELQQAMKEYTQQAYAINQTPEGVATRELLQKWLDQVVLIEKAKARIHAYSQRKQEFGEIYNQFAPWGSSLKKIEREIDLAEDAYLENLHSYNQARLHMQNTIMSANLRVLDAPFYPTEATASKRFILVVVSFLAGFMLVLALVIAFEFMDNTLKNPNEAVKAIGVPLTGVFPKFPINEKRNRRKIDYSFIERRGTDLLLQNIKVEIFKSDKTPKQILVVSTREQEGKTFVSNLIVNQLRDAKYRVLYLHPFEETHPRHPDTLFYRTDLAFWQNLLEESLPTNDYDYVILEMPALLTGQYPVDRAHQADLVLLVARANRSWNAADKKVLESLKKCISNPIKLILNGVSETALETYLGEIPKKRSRLRRWVKRLARMDFTGKSKL